MTVLRLGWVLGGSLLVFAAGCDVKVTTCEEDSSDCDFDFGEDEDAGEQDLDGNAGGDGDAGGGDGDADGGGDGDVDGGAPAGDAAVDAGGEPTELTLTGFCEAIDDVQLAWSSKFDECFCDQGDATATAILGLFGSPTAADDCIDRFGTLTESGKVTFNGIHASACADAFKAAYDLPPAGCPAEGFEYQTLLATIGHGAQNPAQIPACRDTLSGKLAQSAECTQDFECAKGLTCLATAGGGAGTVYTCRPPSVANGPCESNGDCAAGLTCVGNDSIGGRVCLAQVDLPMAGACSASSECMEGRVCAGTAGNQNCAAPTPGEPFCEQ